MFFSKNIITIYTLVACLSPVAVSTEEDLINPQMFYNGSK